MMMSHHLVECHFILSFPHTFRIQLIWHKIKIAFVAVVSVARCDFVSFARILKRTMNVSFIRFFLYI